MNRQAIQLLNELESVLKHHDLWSQTRPDASRLASQVPFAVDSLLFCEWLQFIFLPKLRAITEQGATLPEMQVAPAAQMYLPEQVDSGAVQVVRILQQLDELAG